jgi:hypothetical protein
MLLSELKEKIDSAFSKYGDREVLVDVEATAYDFHMAEIKHAGMLLDDESYHDDPDLLTTRGTNWFVINPETGYHEWIGGSFLSRCRDRDGMDVLSAKYYIGITLGLLRNESSDEVSNILGRPNKISGIIEEVFNHLVEYDFIRVDENGIVRRIKDE